MKLANIYFSLTLNQGGNVEDNFVIILILQVKKTKGLKH